MSDERLNQSPVFRNLDYKWSFFGLNVTDIPLVLIPVFILEAVSIFVKVDAIWIPTTLIASMAFVVLLKWRRPEGYIESLLVGLFAPRRYSHRLRDEYKLPPLPVIENRKPKT